MGEDELEKNAFALWITGQVEGDDSPFESYRELARKTKLSPTTIRRLRDGDKPTLNVLQKLALATHYDLAELQRMAGYLEGDRDAHNELDMFIQNIVKRLPPEGKRIMAKIAEELWEQQQGGK